MSDLFQGPFVSPSDALNIRARPKEHEAILRRQGQFARIVSAKKCPCVANGRVNLFCTVCRGLGVIFSYQKDALVIDEEIPHNGCNYLFPKGTPLTDAIAVKKIIHESQGGNKDYEIVNFTENKITVAGCPPRRYEKVLATYKFSLLKSVIDENSTHDGSYRLTTINTKTDMKKSANAFNISGDIVEVTRIYNVTKDVTYTVEKFFKQTIIIDDVNGTIAAPEVADELQVDYKYVDPAYIGTGRLTVENAMQTWGEDVQEGDVQAIIPGYYYINKGDLITFLFPRIKRTDVIIRGNGQKDEIPQFDIVDILEDIIDQDGNKYDSTKYNLEEYNDLVWESGEGPAQGKRYTISYTYRPTYRIYKQNIDLMSNENKRFPNLCLLRFVNKFNKKEFLELM